MIEEVIHPSLVPSNFITPDFFLADVIPTSSVFVVVVVPTELEDAEYSIIFLFLNYHNELIRQTEKTDEKLKPFAV